MAGNGIYAVFFVTLPAAFVDKSGRNMLFCHFHQRSIRDRSGYLPFWTGRPERTDDNGRETERATETPLPWQKSISGRIDQARTPSNVQTPYNGTNSDGHQVTYRHKKRAGFGSASRPSSAPHPHNCRTMTANKAQLFRDSVTSSPAPAQPVAR